MPSPPPLPRRGRASIPSMSLDDGVREKELPAAAAKVDAVDNADMEKLIPLVNKLQDALSRTDVNEEISLPQIAVVGGQSSGKSSVLENIVGKSFLPRGAGIVTRRPLVLQLVNWREEFGEFLHAPGQKFYDFEEIRREIEDDTERVCGTNKGLSAQAIHLKVYSPHVLNLTLIDLPGATKVAVGDQPEDISVQIQNMILSYISKPTCIMLAVTPANTDLANSDALQLSRMVDPHGDRTLGVVTKLDLMDRGTDARAIFTGASSDLPMLKLGYVGVVNRSQADITERKTIAESRRAEEEFFARSQAYTDLSHRLGTSFLVRECARLLVANIKASLPTLERELAAALAKRKLEYAELGDQTPDIKKRKLTETLLLFCDRYHALVSGTSVPASDRGDRAAELLGGARVERIFRDVFVLDVNALQVLDDLSPSDVQTLVRNVHGIGGGLFTPDKAFVQLVRRNIRRLYLPATKCVKLVHAELLALVEDAANCATLRAYPDLRANLELFVTDLLRKNLDDAAQTISTLLDMELCRVNITHPDFVGARGITGLMASVESRLKRQPSRAKAPLQPRLDDDAAASLGGGKPQPRFFGAAKASKQPPSVAAGKKTMTPEEIAAFRERMIAEVGEPTLRTDNDGDNGELETAKLIQCAAGLSLKEEVEVNVICELCASYFSIVKKTMADLVPKAITLKLVDASIKNMTPKVLAHLNTEDTVTSLMASSPHIVQLGEKLETSIVALEQARTDIERATVDLQALRLQT